MQADLWYSNNPGAGDKLLGEVFDTLAEGKEPGDNGIRADLFHMQRNVFERMDKGHVRYCEAHCCSWMATLHARNAPLVSCPTPFLDASRHV